MPWGPDPYGTPREHTGRRFDVNVIGHEPDEEQGWRYKLQLVDRAYNDSDRYPIDAIAHGDTWEEAFACAIDWIERALDADHCIF